MADQDIVIRLRLDKSGAEASSKKFFDTLRRQQSQHSSEHVKTTREETAARARAERESAAAITAIDRDLLKSRVALAKALTKEKQASDQDARRSARETLKAIVQEHMESNRRITQEARAASRLKKQVAADELAAEKEATRARNAAFTAEMDQLRRRSAGYNEALRKRQADENALRVLLDKGQIAERARTELNQQLNRQRIDGAKRVLAAEDRTFRGLKESAKESATSLGDLVSRYAGITTVIGGVMAISKAWADVAQKQREAHADFVRIMKESRLGAGVKGISAETYGAQSAQIAARSGLSVAEADQMTRGFEGALPIALEKGNIDRTTADDLLQQTAVMGARLGGDQGSRGELAALVGANTKITSAEQGLGKVEAIRQALTAGRGDDPELTRELLQVNGSLAREGGMLGSEEETAAVIGVTSLAGGPQSAGTRALQLNRALRGTTTKQAQALEKEFGIKVGSTEGMESRLDKMIPKLREMSKTTDVGAYLRDTLDLPEENAQALLETMPQYETLKGRMASARETAKTGGAKVLAENKSFLASPEGVTMRSQAESEAGKFQTGQGLKEFGAITAKAQAQIDAEAPTFWKQAESWEANTLGPAMGKGTQAEQRAIRALEDEIKARGLKNPLGGITGRFRDSFMSPSDRFTELSGALKSGGVDPLQAVQDRLAPKLDRLIELAQEGNKDRKDAKPKPPHIANPGPPRQQPPRP